jgi:hypothetical protein
VYIVNFPCPRCAVERTVRLSVDRPGCLNCLLRRRRGGRGAAGRFAAPRPTDRTEPTRTSAA